MVRFIFRAAQSVAGIPIAIRCCLQILLDPRCCPRCNSPGSALKIEFAHGCAELGLWNIITNKCPCCETEWITVDVVGSLR